MPDGKMEIQSITRKDNLFSVVLEQESNGLHDSSKLSGEGLADPAFGEALDDLALTVARINAFVHATDKLVITGISLYPGKGDDAQPSCIIKAHWPNGITNGPTMMTTPKILLERNAPDYFTADLVAAVDAVCAEAVAFVDGSKRAQQKLAFEGDTDPDTPMDGVDEHVEATEGDEGTAEDEQTSTGLEFDPEHDDEPVAA